MWVPTSSVATTLHDTTASTCGQRVAVAERRHGGVDARELVDVRGRLEAEAAHVLHVACHVQRAEREVAGVQDRLLRVVLLVDDDLYLQRCARELQAGVDEDTPRCRLLRTQIRRRART
jgi:hypothetical protein